MHRTRGRLVPFFQSLLTQRIEARHRGGDSHPGIPLAAARASRAGNKRQQIRNQELPLLPSLVFEWRIVTYYGVCHARRSRRPTDAPSCARSSRNARCAISHLRKVCAQQRFPIGRGLGIAPTSEQHRPHHKVMQRTKSGTARIGHDLLEQLGRHSGLTLHERLYNPIVRVFLCHDMLLPISPGTHHSPS